MALPKIVQKLFSDEGKGSKLRPDIIPTSINGNSPDSEGNFTPDQTGCLPLIGGMVTGTIKTSSSIQKADDYSYFDITGATAWNKGSYLSLSGKDSDRGGRFDLCAHNGTTNKTLMGKPDGSLTWGGNNVVRSVNGTFADANGDVTLTVGGSTAYQIPFGTCSTSYTVPEKVATITNGATFSLEQGSIVAIKFSHGPTKFTTLNVDSSGAKEVRAHFLEGEADDSMLNIFLSFTHTNYVFVFVFDGTYWNFVTAHGIGEIVGIT